MYSAHTVVDGFPAKSASHGSFGWSSVSLLHGQGRVILVETGPPSYIPLLSAALERLALSPADVTDVLITHAHWDHLGNIEMFPGARKWIGAGELDWALSLPPTAPFVSVPHVRELRRPGAAVTEVTDGDHFLPGITAVATPGHTPGHMAFAARCTSGPIVFAGDAVKNVRELTTLVPDSTLDNAASRASMQRIKDYMATTGALVVPGHDVPLRLQDGSIVRTAPQQAQISFFASAHTEAQDRTIRDVEPSEANDVDDVTSPIGPTTSRHEHEQRNEEQ